MFVRYRAIQIIASRRVVFMTFFGFHVYSLTDYFSPAGIFFFLC